MEPSPERILSNASAEARKSAWEGNGNGIGNGSESVNGKADGSELSGKVNMKVTYSKKERRRTKFIPAWLMDTVIGLAEGRFKIGKRGLYIPYVPPKTVVVTAERKSKLEFKAKVKKKSTQILRQGPPLFNVNLGIINTNSSFIARWDLYSLGLLLFTAIMTPFEIGFLTTDGFDALFWVNRIVDISFLVDLGLNFHYPYTNAHGSVVTDLRLIRRHYLRGWFAIDAISLLPLELVRILLEDGRAARAVDTPGDSDEAVTSVNFANVFRVIRLFRIIRLLRILRSSRIFKRWESRLAINYGTMNLMGLILGLCFMAHWMACVWACLLRIEGEGHLEDFCNDQEGFCEPWSEGQSEEEYYEAVERTWRERPVHIYFQLLSWALGLLLGNGYQIGYVSSVQRGIILVYMVCAGVANAFIIGNVVNWIDSTQELNREFHSAMDHLNAYIKDKNLDDPETVLIQDGEAVDGPTFCARCREYYIFAHDYLKRLHHFKEIQNCGSKAISNIIATTLYTNNEMKKIKFFRISARDLIARVSKSVLTEILCVNEAVFTNSSKADSLYIISTGHVFVHFQILTDGQSFGHRVFFTNKSDAVRGHTATCLTNCVLYRIMRPDLMEALQYYGDTWTSRKGKQIRYLSIVRLNANILNFYTVIRRAAFLGIRYGFTAGVQVLLTEYGEREVLMEPERHVMSIYSAFVMRLVRSLHRHHNLRAAREAEGDSLARASVDSTTDDLISSNALTQLRSIQSRSRRASAMEDEGDLREFIAQWEREQAAYLAEADLAQASQEESDSVLDLLRDTRLKGLGLEAFHEYFEDHNLNLHQVQGMTVDQLQHVTGMPLGKALAFRSLMDDDACARNLTKARELREHELSTGAAAQDVFVRSLLDQYNVSREHVQIVIEWRKAVFARKNELAVFLAQRRFKAMSLEKYTEALEREQLTLAQMRRLTVADLAATVHMPAGDAMRLLDALRAADIVGTAPGADAQDPTTDPQVADILVQYDVSEEDIAKLRMWHTNLVQYEPGREPRPEDLHTSQSQTVRAILRHTVSRGVLQLVNLGYRH